MKKEPQRRRSTLRLRHLALMLEFMNNGGKATRAYALAYPGVAVRTAAVNASRLLTKADIQREIETRSALETAVDARGRGPRSHRLRPRADIRLLFGEDNKLLPVHDWSANVAQSVKSIRPGKDGTMITLNDSLAARSMILELTGKLKNPLGGVN